MTELKHKEKVKVEELNEDTFMEDVTEETTENKYEAPTAKEVDINF